MRIALIGYGGVARAFSRLLERMRPQYPFHIVAIHTARHGSAYDTEGISGTPNFGPNAASIAEFLDRSQAEVLVELSSLNPETGEPATSYIRAAFERGMHVVTANKGPVAYSYAVLAQIARERGLAFLHEGVTMDGTPVYNLVRETLPGVEIRGFSGALNSTTKVIVDAMRRGLTMDQAIEEARKLGVTEADPWFDIEGWDSACKAAALANVLMDARLTPKDVDRKGLGRMTPDKLAELDAKGKTVVLISRARRTSEGVKLRVRAEVLAKDDMLASCHGTSNLLILHTDLMGDLGVFTIRPGVEQTAYGVFSDLVAIARGRGRC